MSFATAKSGKVASRKKRFGAELLGGSALVSISMLFAPFALAQAQDAPAASNETVTVTGSLIRGVAHTGSDLVTLDQDSMKDIGATTVQQLLTTVPALTQFGTEGAFFSGGSQDRTGSSSPVIHGIGAVVSDGTLVLIDGHRIAQTGQQQTVTDPGVVPSGAIQRVEILPDGASSLYGADAVAGVVNFITKKDFEGIQTDARFGHADHWQTSDITAELGQTWNNGGAMLSYEFSSKSNLLASARPYTVANKIAFGGPNLGNFFCGPASITQTSASSGAASNAFLYPYTNPTIGSAGNSNLAPCDYSGLSSLEPAETHNAVLMSFHQKLSERFTISGDFNWSSRVDNLRQSRGTVSATVFGPTGSSGALGTGSQNPFYVGNPTIGTSSEFVRVDFDDLLGPGAHSKAGATNMFADMQVDADIGFGWAATLAGTAGTDTSFARAYGAVCQACALLALNGTTNVGGAAQTTPTTSSLSDYYQLSTVTNVTRVLSTANALDVWNPKATNKTSAQVLKELTDSGTNLGAVQTLNEVRLKFDGPLFELPAGELSAALGGQFDESTDHQMAIQNNGTGPTLSSSKNTDVYMSRQVFSTFAEFFVPLVSPQMNIPLVNKLDLDLSGRYDHYSDFGDTSNPKIGLSWILTEGLSARASYGSSFTAPHFNSEGQKGTGLTSATSVSVVSTPFTIAANHPSLPGSFCATSPQTACSVSAAQMGIGIASGNPDILPQHSTSYSAGFNVDGGKLWAPLKGFTSNITYWQVKFQDVIDQPQLPNLLTNPGLQSLLELAPPGGWAVTSPQVQAAIGKLPVTVALPTTVFYIENMLMTNSFNEWINGIDFDERYTYDSGTYGLFSLDVSGSDKLRFDGQGICQPVGCPTTSPQFSFLNGLHNSSSQHVIALAGRTSLTWILDSMSVMFAWNYVNPYWNPITIPPYNTATYLPTGVTGGGYQKIHAQNTFDLNLGYTLPEGLLAYGVTDGMQISLNIMNILNSAPPFYATNGGFGGTLASGYDNYNATPLGRLVTIGLEKKW